MFGKNLKSISIALFLIILASAAQIQAQTCATAPVGLVAAYSGDGNALDARSRNNGTIQGNVTFAAGEVGQGLQVGGANGDRVIVGNPANLQLQEFTIEAWIKRSSSSVVTNSPNAGSPGGIFFAYGQGGYAFLIDQNTNRLGLSVVGTSQVLSPTLTITDTNWHHVAVTQSGAAFTGGTGAIFYLDGVADTRSGFQSPFTFTTNAAIGSRGDGQTDNVFFGAIDELAIYNRELSASEIQAIYNSGTTGKCKPLATYAPDNQVLWLAGDGDAKDSSGSGNNGTPLGSAIFTVGKVGQAFKFDGTQQSQITVPDSQSLRPTTAVTVEAWLNPSSAVTGFQGVLFKGSTGSPGGQPYSLFMNGVNHQIVVRVGNDSTFDALGSVGGIPANVYSHVAFTYDGTTIRLYINGVLDSSAASSIGNLAQANTDILRIGGLGGGFTYTGAADEIGIYNRALTAAEIQSISNAGLAGKYKIQSTVPSGIAAWYPGDGNANDLQAANNGTLQGGATYAAGKVGQAFSLNGTDAFVLIPNSTANDPTTAGSIEAWVKFNQTPSAVNRIMEVIGKGSTGTDFDLQGEPDDRFRFYVGGGNFVSSNTLIQANVWYHVAGTWDSTVGLKMYVNGVLENTNAVLTTRGQSGQPLKIGSLANSGSRFFSGLIDEPDIYNRMLTTVEINSIYNAQSGGKYKGASNPTFLNTTKTGDATVTFGTITTAGAVHQTPLDSSSFPALPMGINTGLNYDISTSAVYTNPAVCLNMSSFTPAQFINLRIYHLESGVWQNRTAGGNTYPNLCTNGLTSLSPFAISLLPPTAANVSIGGRITTAAGGGIRGVRVSVTTQSGTVYQTTTGSFGYYKFSELQVGQTYLLSVEAKKYTFANPTRIIDLQEDFTDADFVADDGGIRQTGIIPVRGK